MGKDGPIETKMRPMEMAYHYIKERIINGLYKPSQKLSEREIADATGVSRNTVKKALLKLEKENLVQLEENKGAIIKSFDLDDVINYLEIRRVLEGLVIRSAALFINSDALTSLENIVHEMQLKLEQQQFDDYSHLNKTFHEIIYQSSRNQQAVELINMIKTQLIRFHLRTILIPGRPGESHAEHERILKALQAHDAKAAEAAVMDHIMSILKTIKTNYHLLV